MALCPCKTEMKGTTSRWGRRAEVKISSNKHRRVNDARDVRDQLDAPRYPARATIGTKGKTRHWCRGKRGVPHQLVVRDFMATKRVTWPAWFRTGEGSKILLCAKCGKEFAQHHPRDAMPGHPALPTPDWVTNPPAES